jgi:2-polyprenyl-3-methyl-5-hydroxy-6-metoxy-1,4-benzoquinol methylase
VARERAPRRAEGGARGRDGEAWPGPRMPWLAVRDVDAVELMDDPAADPAALDRTYDRFRLVNAVVSNPGAVYRDWVRPRLSVTHRTRLLDVGAGGADLPRALLARARRDGLPLEVVAIDPDERAAAWVAAQRPIAGLEYRRATSGELADAGERFDVVLSNHVLHHLDGPELGALLADSERLVTPGGVAVHGDIARGPFAYAGFWAGTLPFAWNLLAGSFIRADGLTSIRRSFTPAELAAAVPAGWRVRRAIPSRLELIWGDDGGA